MKRYVVSVVHALTWYRAWYLPDREESQLNMRVKSAPDQETAEALAVVDVVAVLREEERPDDIELRMVVSMEMPAKSESEEDTNF